MLSLSTAILTLASAAIAAPSQPKLTFLFQTNFTIPNSAVIDFGAVPYGSNRSILGITGGVFEGPKMKGKTPNTKILALLQLDIADTSISHATGKVTVGTDWGLTDNRGVFAPDAIFAFETDDKQTIFVTEKGRVPNMHMLFETASEKYDWLNNAVAYATGGPNMDDNTIIQLDVWQLGA